MIDKQSLDWIKAPAKDIATPVAIPGDGGTESCCLCTAFGYCMTKCYTVECGVHCDPYSTPV